MPATCPACGSHTVRESGEVATRCPNRSCPAQIVESIKHFVSKGAMDIDGLGDEAVVALHDARLIENVADLYDLTLSALADVPLFSRKDKGPDGEEIVVPGKLAESVLAALRASKKQPFSRVLLALGMRHVGGVTARALVERFPSIELLQAATPEELAAVPGVGAVVAEAVRQYLDDPRNAETVARLRAHGLRFEEEAREGAPGPLDGRTFVLTGRLEGFTRGEAQTRIEALGGRVSGSVGKGTDYVVAGEEAGSKLDKARSLGVPVLDEASFVDLLGAPDGGTLRLDVDAST
jgi:DNA ligase (NAD+)